MPTWTFEWTPALGKAPAWWTSDSAPLHRCHPALILSVEITILHQRATVSFTGVPGGVGGRALISRAIGGCKSPASRATCLVPPIPLPIVQTRTVCRDHFSALSVGRETEEGGESPVSKRGRQDPPLTHKGRQCFSSDPQPLPSKTSRQHQWGETPERRDWPLSMGRVGTQAFPGVPLS